MGTGTAQDGKADNVMWSLSADGKIEQRFTAPGVTNYIGRLR